ncbi:putative membrane protein YfcA [Comamonas odontotermitis]|uniref:Probable membrane transporter protein n=1 Tax=Comamonas odontotermitis TaxID=379895 RepID=A0ABR6REN5_9BURK|nr:sulfite exporter TauE/SafE family protein [Comamonas odontotermitis]MBB6577607.1 putative membrane protein YfcA [Comamonas odontotermitis]
MTDSGWWLGVAAVFVLAGMVKGVVGLGLPTVSMALLALWLSPATAAAWLVLPSMVTNMWQMRPWPQLRVLARQLWPMQLGVVVGTLGAAWQFGALQLASSQRWLGAALVLYALWGLWGRPLVIPAGAGGRQQSLAHGVLGALVGAATGVVTALTGVFVIPAVPYLQSLGLGKDTLIQAMGLSFSVSTIALAISLQQHGGVAMAQWAWSALWLLPALAGMWCGERLRGRLSPQVFKRCLFASLLLLGTYMALRR